MTQNTIDRLQQFGYRPNSDYLLDHLPENIWVTFSDKNIKRREVNFILTKKESKWVFTLSAPSESYGEIYILHRTEAEVALDAISEMVLYLEDNQMLKPTI